MVNTKTDASLVLLLLIAILLIAGAVVVFMIIRPDPFQESLSDGKPLNTLFVIEHEDRPLSSFVLMYYSDTNRAAIFDIPGSLGLIIQQINRMDRIDAVYDPRRIAPFQTEIERLLDIEISFSIVLDLENIGKLTDLLMGVEVFIPSPVNLYQDGLILFPSGINRLDGDKAISYLNYEVPEESMEMAVFRRQRFFSGLIRRLGEQSQFLSSSTPVSRLLYSLFRTDMNQRTLIRLVEEFAGIDIDRVNFQSVGGDIREVSGQSLLFPHMNGALIRDIVRQTQHILIQAPGSTFIDRSFTVEVLNGTTQTGLAGRTADLFRSFGYDIIAIGNADQNDIERTLIIDRSGYREMAIAFGEIIRCTNIRFDAPDHTEMESNFMFGSFEYRSDFTIILGRDFNGRFVTE